MIYAQGAQELGPECDLALRPKNFLSKSAFRSIQVPVGTVAAQPVPPPSHKARIRARAVGDQPHTKPCRKNEPCQVKWPPQGRLIQEPERHNR